MSQLESVLWEGKPSNWLLLDTFLLALLIGSAVGAGLYYFGLLWSIVLGVPVVIVFLMLFPAWLQLKFIRYTLTDDALTLQRGLRLREGDPIDMFRVLDAGSEEPLLLRLCNIGHVVVYSSDVTHKKCRLIGVRDPVALRTLIRQKAKEARTAHGVREVSMQHAPTHI